MPSKFLLLFDSEHPDLDSFKAVINGFLELYHLTEIYKADDIIARACHQSEQQTAPGSEIEVHLAWLKTTCLEIIKELSRQRENKQKFDIGIQSLFDIENPDSKSFWANVTRTLRQFRLSGTYDVKEIVAEAYAIGIKRIEAGTTIEKPLPWLRTTCFNVVRDLRRKQDRVDHPKLDSEGLTSGDAALSDLIFAEDRKAMRIALIELSAEDRKLLCARVLKNQSWQEIGESLLATETSTLTANTARQRGYRVLQRLRQRYLDIRQHVQISDDECDACLALEPEWNCDID